MRTKEEERDKCKIIKHGNGSAELITDTVSIPLIEIN